MDETTRGPQPDLPQPDPRAAVALDRAIGRAGYSQRAEAPISGRTSALSIDEIVTEARRRVKLYRDAPHGSNLYRADAVEAFLWWIEAAR